MSALAELSSVATALDELLQRVSTITDNLTGAEQEALSSDLLEVERALGTAVRRLGRLMEANRG
ncbi:MAG TPA: hypothetical protein VF942_13120 [Acidimicrobiales bacterium]